MFVDVCFAVETVSSHNSCSNKSAKVQIESLGTRLPRTNIFEQYNNRGEFKVSRALNDWFFFVLAI